MLVFAYDGSMNGDWVAHYAVRFALNTASRALRLVHVQEAASERAAPRIARIAEECEVLGVTMEAAILGRGSADVADRLMDSVPPGATLIVGTRAKPRNKALLAGSVSARLLDAGRFPVIAIHVVHPGVLGQPGSVLVPLEGRPGSAAHVLPLLRLLGEDLQRIHVLFVHEVASLRLRVLGSAGLSRLLAEGRAFLSPIEEELRRDLAPHRFELDSSAVVSDDAPREILLFARKHHARLICLGASERTHGPRVFHANPIERILRDAPADVAVCRSMV